MQEEDTSTSVSVGGDDPQIMIVPIRTLNDGGLEQAVSDDSEVIQNILSGRSVDTSSSSHDQYSSSYGQYSDERLGDAVLSFHSVSGDPEETISVIESSGISDEAITCAAKCGAFWHSLGAETAMYMVSYGTALLANGLIIRFTGANPFVSTLLSDNFAAVSYLNARVLFTSLIKPPQDDLPEDKETSNLLINKYAILPVSWVFGAICSGTALTILRDDSFATQQMVGLPTTLMIGPFVAGVGTLVRECQGGTVDLHPDYSKYKNPKKAFKTVYGLEPNPLDDNRSRRFGMLRDVFLRFLSGNIAPIAAFALNFPSLSTFCIGGQDQFLNATQGNTTMDVNEALNEYCFGGPLTYAFRELGFAVCYGVGVLVVEPALCKLFNMVYDCLYPRDDESSTDEENPRIEEVFDEDV